MTNTIRLKITCFLLLFTVLLIKDILDLAWNLATRMKFGTCEQNWDLHGTISRLWFQLGPSRKGAGASEAGGQTKEGALSKRYFQTSKIAQNRTKSPVPIVIDVFGVTAPYGNPYGSKIAIVWLFFVIF